MSLIDNAAGFINPGIEAVNGNAEAGAWLNLKHSTITNIGALSLWKKWKEQIIIDYLLLGKNFYDTSTYKDGKLISFKERIYYYRINNIQRPTGVKLDFREHGSGFH